MIYACTRRISDSAESAEKRMREAGLSFLVDFCSSDRGKNENAYLGRLIAYETMAIFVKRMTGSNISEIRRDSLGKPYLPNEPLCFSISHTEGLVLVAVSDDKHICSVGADAQIRIDNDRAIRMRERYFPTLSLNKNMRDEKIKFYSLEADCLSEIQSTWTGSDLTSLWTYAEALMKCDGRGFGSIGDIDTLSCECKWDGRCVMLDGEEFYLTVAYR